MELWYLLVEGSTIDIHWRMSIKHSSWIVIHPIISRYDLSTTIVIYSFTFGNLLAEKPVIDLIDPRSQGEWISIEKYDRELVLTH